MVTIRREWRARSEGGNMRTYRRLAAALIVCTVVAAACGSDDNNAADTSTAPAETGAPADTGAAPTATGASDATEAPTGQDPGLAAATAAVAKYLDPNQPIGLTIPLTGKPEPKKFAWLECELESCPY